jgi:hypothetical protein
MHVRPHVESIRRKLPLQNDLGFVLERVGNDARVVRLDHTTRFARPGRIVLNLELPLKRVGLAHTGADHHVAFQLHRLSFPRLTLRQDFIDVLEILSPVPQCRPQQAHEGRDQHRTRRTHLDISMCHKDFREKTCKQNSPTRPSDAMASGPGVPFPPAVTRAALPESARTARIRRRSATRPRSSTSPRSEG